MTANNPIEQKDKNCQEFIVETTEVLKELTLIMQLLKDDFFQALKEAIRKISDAQRLELFTDYCYNCGRLYENKLDKCICNQNLDMFNIML